MDAPNQIDGIEEGQMTLELSANNFTLVRPPTPGWRKALRPPSHASKGILGLPDELLHSIICLVMASRSFHSLNHRHDRYQPYIALAKTCWRFNRLVTPMMYSQLNLCIGVEDTGIYCDKYPVEVMRKLLRSFKENPLLGEFCKKLNVALHHPRRLEPEQWRDRELPDVPLDEEVEADVEVITALAALLPGTRSIYVEGEIHRYQEIWTILGTAGANMPQLDNVTLIQYGDAAQGPICDSLCRVGTLKSLHISLVEETTGASEVTKQYPVYIEKMHIENFRYGPENLRHLVSWPERVDYLELANTQLGSDDLDASWGLGGLMPVISCHKDTLRTLVIGRVPSNDMGLSGFSVTDFPNLEELGLSYWSTGGRVAGQGNLLAPRLKKFTWCFNEDGRVDGLPCRVGDFGESEEIWLRRLMRTAVKQEACLSHVHIRFDPYGFEYPENDSDLAGIVLPWGRIEMLRDEFCHSGIKVTCKTGLERYRMMRDYVRTMRSPNNSPPPHAPLPEPGTQLPDAETDSESIVSLDGEDQINKIARYFRPLPLRQRTR